MLTDFRPGCQNRPPKLQRVPPTRCHAVPTWARPRAAVPPGPVAVDKIDRMTLRPNLAGVLSYLSALKRHNNREWFEAHRSDYETARGEFEAFVDGLIHDLCEFERLDGVKPKECIRRIYRDIRFSANKTPYKTHMSAEIVAGGTKATRLPYYIHLSPKNGSIIAGGLYHPSTADLVRFRQAIASDARPFKRIAARARRSNGTTAFWTANG